MTSPMPVATVKDSNNDRTDVSNANCFYFGCC
jgi:hypothetical protein